jgi:uncharacterized protein (DUF3820 family)
MVGEILMPFGKYFGKSIALVSLTDYPYLAWVSDKIGANAQRREAGRILRALDTFEPQASCIKCGNKATRFSIVSDGNDWLIDEAYLLCSGDECWNHFRGVSNRYEEPIKYSVLSKYSYKGARQQKPSRVREFHEILNACAGFRGVLNERSAQTFIDDLVRKTGA